MKIKDIIRESKINWVKAHNSNPSFLSAEQTEITWDDYKKLEQKAIDFDNLDVNVLEDEQ